MDFFKCSIAGISYGTGVTEIERATAKRLGNDLGRGATEAGSLSPWHEKGFNLNDPRLMNGAWADEARSDVIKRFFQVSKCEASAYVSLLLTRMLMHPPKKSTCIREEVPPGED